MRRRGDAWSRRNPRAEPSLSDHVGWPAGKLVDLDRWASLLASRTRRAWAALMAGSSDRYRPVRA